MNIVPEMMTKLAKCGSLIEIEEVILRSMLELGQRVMQTYLEALDDQLSSEVPITHQMALAPRSRQSPYLVKMMAKLGQATTMRNTAMALNMLFDSGVSHSAVMEAVHALGAEVIKQLRKPRQPAAGGFRNA